MIHNKPLEEMSSEDRKRHPIHRGVMMYFPDAIAAVANVSLVGNEQHNPGEPMHWAREKSQDHADCIARHQLSVGTLDKDGTLHSAKTAWRALAQLQLEIEGYRKLEAAKDPQPSTESCRSQDDSTPESSINETVAIVKGSSPGLNRTVQESINLSEGNAAAWRNLTSRNWTVVAFRPPVKGDCYVSIGVSFSRLSINADVVKCTTEKTTYPDERFIVAGGSIA